MAGAKSPKGRIQVNLPKKNWKIQWIYEKKKIAKMWFAEFAERKRKLVC